MNPSDYAKLTAITALKNQAKKGQELAGHRQQMSPAAAKARDAELSDCVDSYAPADNSGLDQVP